MTEEVKNTQNNQSWELEKINKFHNDAVNLYHTLQYHEEDDTEYGKFVHKTVHILRLAMGKISELEEQHGDEEEDE